MRVNSPIFRRSLLAKNISKSRRLNLNGLQLAALSCGNVASQCWRFLRGPCLVLRVLIDVIPIFIQENRGSERLGYLSQAALNKPSPGCSASHQPDVLGIFPSHLATFHLGTGYGMLLLHGIWSSFQVAQRGLRSEF